MIERIRSISDLQKTILMIILWICVIALLIILSSCYPFDIFFNGTNIQLEQTRGFLDLRSTQLVLEATQLHQETAETIYPTRLAQDIQSTYQASHLKSISTLTTQSAQKIDGMAAQKPEILLTPTSDAILPREVIPEMNLTERIKASKILLYEDMAGWGGSRYIKDALDSAGYSYTDVGSAQGWLKNNILSNKTWDLIIVASEARTKIQGEFFEILLDEIHKGTAIIIEIWDGDKLAEGKLGFLLSQCGLEIHGDWYNPGIRTLYVLTPDHPVFNEPNPIDSIKTSLFWADDIGDLVRVIPEGDATILAGTMNGHPNDHGVITTCFGGRVIIQSFSDHDYERTNMMHLWQNYVYFTLKNHYQFVP